MLVVLSVVAGGVYTIFQALTQGASQYEQIQTNKSAAADHEMRLFKFMFLSRSMITKYKFFLYANLVIVAYFTYYIKFNVIQEFWAAFRSLIGMLLAISVVLTLFGITLLTLWSTMIAYVFITIVMWVFTGLALWFYEYSYIHNVFTTFAIMSVSMYTISTTISFLVCVSTPFLFASEGTPSPITIDDSKVFNDMIVEEDYEVEQPLPAEID